MGGRKRRMSETRLYVGINGVMICLEHKTNINVSGCFYHLYSREGVTFESLEQMIHRMEELYNELSFPQPGNVDRMFTGATEQNRSEGRMIKVMSDEELLNKHGDLGTFFVQVQHRQNNSWQGRVTWVDENKTVYFRSVWELLKLIENAIDTVEPQEEKNWT